MVAEIPSSQEKYSVILSYDILTPPGLQEKFKELMTKRKWIFIYSGKKMPATTCYINFKEGFTRSQYIQAAQNHIKEVESEINKEDPTFKVERYFFVAYPTLQSQIVFKSISKD
jgi:hypothetical protein